MGRGKKISLDTAGQLLAQLEKFEPVKRGHYASVSAFVSQHHDEFLVALQRGVTHEQIADLMLEHDITVSPTTLRRYLPKQPDIQEMVTASQVAEKVETFEASELTIEQWVCVAIATMYVLDKDGWQDFQQLCELNEIQVEYVSQEDDEIDEVSFTRDGQVFKQLVDHTFVILGDRQLSWEQIDPDDSERSRLIYEVVKQQAPELLSHVHKLAARFQQS
ncbi:MAG: hypothetical protein AAGB13_10565 [Cyanobacteria bacterium P01_F01_bin.33]